MKLAVIRIRGDFHMPIEIRDTLKMLNLKKKNNCVVVEDTPVIVGMLKRAETYITWGKIDDQTLAALQKKGEKIIRLSPPRKGYGRKGIKLPFKLKGAYGNRAEKINDLLTRMM